MFVYSNKTVYTVPYKNEYIFPTGLTINHATWNLWPETSLTLNNSQMTKKTDHSVHASRIGIILDSSSTVGQQMVTGLNRRASSYPELKVRRFFEEALASQGIDPLINWQPDALVVFCDSSAFLKQVREALPDAPTVCMCAMPADLVDVLVTASIYEVTGLALEHFAENGIAHFAQFYVGDEVLATRIQAEVFQKHLRKKKGTFSSFRLDSNITDLLRAPTTEALDEIGTWLENLPKPVGIYASSDHGAAYLVRICTHLGLAIPKQVQVIGGSGLGESLESVPHITTIDLPSERIGGTALETVFRLLKGEVIEEKILRVDGATLVPLGSTGNLLNQISNIPAAIAYIEAKAAQGIHVDDVFEQTQSVSLMTFYRDFKKQAGELPALYIRRVRLDTARRLLSTTQLDITRVAELSGFSSSNYFAQIFRRELGMTPNQYRKSHKKT